MIGLRKEEKRKGNIGKKGKKWPAPFGGGMAGPLG